MFEAVPTSDRTTHFSPLAPGTLTTLCAPCHREPYVLARGTAEGRTVQVIEYPGSGGLAIRIDGEISDHLRWPDGDLDKCMRAYLNLIHYRPG